MPDRPTLVALSSLTPDGAYVTAVEYGEDHVLGLDRDAAVRYALAVMQACRYAEYDAAVWAQLAGEVRMDPGLVAMSIKQLRNERPPLDTAATAPFGFDPVFSHVTGKPALRLAVDGEQVGELDTADALNHALDVLTGSALSDVDTVYLSFLRSTGLDERFALGLVDQLRRFGAWQRQDSHG